MPSYSVRCATTRAGESARPPALSTLTFTDADGFVLCDPAPPLQFDLADLTGAVAAEGELRLTLTSGLSIRISGMGKVAGELVSKFVSARRERTAYVFRFGTPAGEYWDEADVFRPGEPASKRAGIKLFPSLLGVVPDQGEPLSLPYADMRAVSLDANAYQIMVELTGGGIWRIGKLAKRT